MFNINYYEHRTSKHAKLYLKLCAFNQLDAYTHLFFFFSHFSIEIVVLCEHHSQNDLSL